MSFVGNRLLNSFKKELLEGSHNFKNSGGSDFKLALFVSSQQGSELGGTSGTIIDETVQYYNPQASYESSGTNYTAGGASLTRVDPTSTGTTAFTDFADLTFSNVSVSGRGALIYNNSIEVADSDAGTANAKHPAVCALDFNTTKSASSGDFTIVFPTGDVNNAIIRIA
jgi:hypothetical protein